jgi:hypothetical protein
MIYDLRMNLKLATPIRWDSIDGIGKHFTPEGEHIDFIDHDKVCDVYEMEIARLKDIIAEYEWEQGQLSK